MGALLQHVTNYPDAYVYERAAAFDVTLQAIHYALKRLGISYKKSYNILTQVQHLCLKTPSFPQKLRLNASHIRINRQFF